MASNDQHEDALVQTSVRFPSGLYKEFQSELERQSRKMTSVLRELVESWVRTGIETDPVPLIRSYLTWLPMTAAVKDIYGRTLYGNHEFLELICVKDDEFVGKKPSDYLKKKYASTAKYIEDLDARVREVKEPILCTEIMPLGNKIHHRMAIRFPIFSGNDPKKDLESTGVLGFDLEQMKAVAEGLDPEPGGRRQCEFGESLPTQPRCLGHCLGQFIEAVPAIATIKARDGRLLFVNSEYTNVLGKKKSEVENRLSREIWGGEIAELIVAHDYIVRQTGKPYVSVERIPTLEGERDRLNVRFPIYDDVHNLIMTGTIGFDSDLIRRGVELLSRGGPDVCAYLFDESLKQVYP